MRHGTSAGYQYHGCRCQPCRTAARTEVTNSVARRAAYFAAHPREFPHGKSYGYILGCRDHCCRAPEAVRRAKWRAKKRSSQ